MGELTSGARASSASTFLFTVSSNSPGFWYSSWGSASRLHRSADVLFCRTVTSSNNPSLPHNHPCSLSLYNVYSFVVPVLWFSHLLPLPSLPDCILHAGRGHVLLFPGVSLENRWCSGLSVCVSGSPFSSSFPGSGAFSSS